MNIGISCRLSSSHKNSSVKQAAINLYDCLTDAGHNVTYLSDSRNISNFNKDHVAHEMSRAHEEGFPDLDLIILHGFSISEEFAGQIKKRHKTCKIVMYHHGNRLAIDQHALITGADFLNRMPFVDEIWLPPHHQNAAHYVKVFHNTDATVKTVPYLWSPFFVNQALKEKKRIKYDPSAKKQVIVLEPNRNSSKTCLVPLIICENFNKVFPQACMSFSFFNTSQFRGNKSFNRFLEGFKSAKEDKLYFNKKWWTMDAIERVGQIILSHQTDNELNYLYFEALYLGLPLIHNSPRIKEYGYYYPDSDILTASNQIYNAILHHEENLAEYKKQNNALIEKYSPTNPENIRKYAETISHLSKK